MQLQTQFNKHTTYYILKTNIYEKYEIANSVNIGMEAGCKCLRLRWMFAT